MSPHDITGRSYLAYRDNVTLCTGPVSALTEAVCLTPELAATSPAQTRLDPAWARDTDVAGALCLFTSFSSHKQSLEKLLDALNF